MTDYTSAIAAIKVAMGTGILTVTSDGATTTYRSFLEMQKTLQWMEAQQAATAPAQVGFAKFESGDD